MVFCSAHKSSVDRTQLGLTVAGALVGNIIASDIGGVVAGAAVGNLSNRISPKKPGSNAD